MLLNSLCIVLKDAKFSSAPCCQSDRVTEEAQVAETAVWSIHFLINMFTALKGSVLFVFIII